MRGQYRNQGHFSSKNIESSNFETLFCSSPLVAKISSSVLLGQVHLLHNKQIDRSLCYQSRPRQGYMMWRSYFRASEGFLIFFVSINLFLVVKEYKPPLKDDLAITNTVLFKHCLPLYMSYAVHSRLGLSRSRRTLVLERMKETSLAFNFFVFSSATTL